MKKRLNKETYGVHILLFLKVVMAVFQIFNLRRKILKEMEQSEEKFFLNSFQNPLKN